MQGYEELLLASLVRPLCRHRSLHARPTDGEVCDLRYPVVILDGGLPAPRGAGAHAAEL